MNSVGARRNESWKHEEVRVNEEWLVMRFHPEESIHDVCIEMERDGVWQDKVMEVMDRYCGDFPDIPRRASIIEHRDDLTEDRRIRCK